MVKYWNPVDDEYEDYSPGTPEPLVSTIVEGANIDVNATDPANPIVSVEGVVHSTGNETAIAGDKEWTGSHEWDYGADGKAEVLNIPANDSPTIGIKRSGDTTFRVSLTAPTAGFGVGSVAFTNGAGGSAGSIYDTGTDVVAGGARGIGTVGKTGATATPMVLGGGTTSGSPVSGAHIKGELVCDDTGVLYRCTAAGTPGNWVPVNSVNPTFTGTVTIPDNALAIADTSGLQTALDAKQPLDADLTDIANIADAQGDMIIRGSAGWERLAKSATSTDVLTAGASQPTWSAGDSVPKSLYNAHTVLAATTDDTPVPLTVAEQTLLGRITGGNIDALTPTQARTLLGLVVGTNVQAWDADLDDLATVWVKATTASPSSHSYYEAPNNGTDRVIVTAPAAMAGTKFITWPDASGAVALTGHVHAGADITTGLVALARGGANADLSAFTTNNYLRKAASAIEQRTPAQVLSDIGGIGSSALTPYLLKLAAGATIEDVGAIESNVSTVSGTGAVTLDTSVYGVFDVTMTGNRTFTFSNPAPSGKASVFVLILRGAFTPTFPAAVQWSDVTAPTYTTASIFTFTTVDSGTKWMGSQVGKAYT